MLCFTNILLESITKKREEETEGCSCKHGGGVGVGVACLLPVMTVCGGGGHYVILSSQGRTIWVGWGVLGWRAVGGVFIAGVAGEVA